ncbi:MAG: hypothetical protein ACQEXJ_22425 [Myxococcota bacterium]
MRQGLLIGTMLMAVGIAFVPSETRACSCRAPYPIHPADGQAVALDAGIVVGSTLADELELVDDSGGPVPHTVVAFEGIEYCDLVAIVVPDEPLVDGATYTVGDFYEPLTVTASAEVVAPSVPEVSVTYTRVLHEEFGGDYCEPLGPAYRFSAFVDVVATGEGGPFVAVLRSDDSGVPGTYAPRAVDYAGLSESGRTTSLRLPLDDPTAALTLDLYDTRGTVVDSLVLGAADRCATLPEWVPVEGAHNLEIKIDAEPDEALVTCESHIEAPPDGDAAGEREDGGTERGAGSGSGCGAAPGPGAAWVALAALLLAAASRRSRGVAARRGPAWRAPASSQPNACVRVTGAALRSPHERSGPIGVRGPAIAPGRSHSGHGPYVYREDRLDSFARVCWEPGAAKGLAAQTFGRF